MYGGDSFYNHGASICINQDGDVLKPYDKLGPSDTVRDGVSFKIYSVAGYHVGCGGNIDYDVVGGQYGYLRCRRCGLRETFPANITTYEELYEHCHGHLADEHTEVPEDWECYGWDRDHRMRCGTMRCPLKGKCTAGMS